MQVNRITRKHLSLLQSENVFQKVTYSINHHKVNYGSKKEKTKNLSHCQLLLLLAPFLSKDQPLIVADWLLNFFSPEITFYAQIQLPFHLNVCAKSKFGGFFFLFLFFILSSQMTPEKYKLFSYLWFVLGNESFCSYNYFELLEILTFC